MVRHWQRIGVVIGLTGLVAGALLGLPTVASAAPPSFGAPVTVVSAGCNFDEVTGDTKLSSDSVTRGFVSFLGGTCGQEPAIRYFRQSGSGWSAATSPYRGRVLAVAADGISTWLLYANFGGIHLGRRTTAGGFAASQRLSTVGLSGAVNPTGDLVASGGRYWAVWSEQVGPGGEFAQTELFQALTLGQGHFHDGIARQRITSTTTSDDIEPSLTLDPRTSGDTARVIMVWNRNDGAQGLVSTLRTASASFDGRWASRQWTPAGTFASSPDLHAIPSQKLAVAAYVAGGRIVQASNAPATVRTNRFSRAGSGPRTTRTLTANYTAWTSNAQHVVLARSGGAGSITFEVDLTPSAGQQQLIGVTARSGKALVLGASFTSNRLYSIAQR
jgi:hypothetical protein